MKKKILFGAGMYGRLALEKYGRENVAYFVDNNEKLIGNEIDGVCVIGFERLKEIYKDYEIVVSTKFRHAIAEQLSESGIVDYAFYYNEKAKYYPTDDLVVNPYKDEAAKYLDSSEIGITQKMKDMEYECNALYEKSQLFNHVEIETVNRCNGNCSFCPVSVKNDTRDYCEMSWELFERIIVQLAELNYDGRLALFSNNEPFLDKTIVEKHRYAREKCPNARMHLFTNGTLLTLNKFLDIIPYLDELVIDNYNQKLELIKPCIEIRDYCELHPELKSKVTIVLRKQQEILSNRGGDAPNRTDSVSYPTAKCVLPFKQMIIRPDGKVSLCCNDPLGRNTLADLTKETLVEAWNNPRFQMVRNCLHEGRGNWKHCVGCDVFNMG